MINKNVLEIISQDQLTQLRDAGFVVIHRQINEGIKKAMLSARDSVKTPVSIDVEKSYHRAIAESIRQQQEAT